MNYTIIGQSDDNSYHDRCGDFISRPGTFETEFFREDDKAAFLKTWAHATFHNTYENLIILINGIPDNKMTDEEFDQFDDLDREMRALLPAIKEEYDFAERARKEAEAQAAVEKARKIAADQRARDLQQLEALKKKLGV